MNQPRNKKQFCERLAALCDRYKISVNKLSDLCGGLANKVGRSTAHRLLRNELNEEYVKRIRPTLARNLQKFFLNLEMPVSEIETELSQLFSAKEYEPMNAKTTELTGEAIRFFGLDGDPFTHSPESMNELFTSPVLDSLEKRIVDAIRYPKFLCMTGEIGAGKTIMLKRVQERVHQSEGTLRLIQPEFFDMSKVSVGSIASTILRELGVKVPRDVVARATAIKSELARLYQSGIHVALLFDEAHRLSDDVLSSLKNFFEMCSSGGFTKHLSIIIIGQPSISQRLQSTHFQEIFQRVLVVQMPDFKDTAAAYLDHRLRLAGSNLKTLFDTKAVALLAKQARTPLALGNLANAALMEAYKLSEKQVLVDFLKGSVNGIKEPTVLATRKVS